MLRSTKKALDYIKEQDPNTCITQHTIRKWCYEGKVKYIMAGTKMLILLESLLDFIDCNNSTKKLDDN